MTPNQIIRGFLKGKTVSLVNVEMGPRNQFKRLFEEFGCKVLSANPNQSIEEYGETFQQFKPDIVVCGNVDVPGVELFVKLRLTTKPIIGKDASFYLTAPEEDQKIAEAFDFELSGIFPEQVDQKSFLVVIVNAVARQSRPDPAIILTQAGRDLFDKKEYTAAEMVLQQSFEYDARPALQNYYLGVIAEKRDDREAAMAHFIKALRYNKLHFRSLMALLRNLLACGQVGRGIAVYEKLLDHFPVPLSFYLKLLQHIQVDQYAHLEAILALYYKLPDSPAKVALGVEKLYCQIAVKLGLRLPDKAAALVIAGYGISKKIDFLQNALQILMAKKCQQAALKIWGQLDRRIQEHDNLQVPFVAVILYEKGFDAALSTGRQLAARSDARPELFRFLIEVSFERGLKDGAENLISMALKRFPSHAEKFLKMSQAA